ncbi:unnamed protein product, partial [Cyprideis torosa]
GFPRGSPTVPNGSVVRRAFWVLLTFGLILFSIWQIWTAVIKFYEVPRTTNIKIEKKRSLPFPAITICPLTPFKIVQSSEGGTDPLRMIPLLNSALDELIGNPENCRDPVLFIQRSSPRMMTFFKEREKRSTWAFNALSDTDFRMRYRKSKGVVQQLADELRDDLEPTTKCWSPWNLEDLGVLTIVIGDTLELSQPVIRVQRRIDGFGGPGSSIFGGPQPATAVLHASYFVLFGACRLKLFIGSVRDRVIRFPPRDEAAEMVVFQQVRGFAGVIGCTDATHVRIIGPHQHENETITSTERSMCKQCGTFSNVAAQWSGSVLDSRILRCTAMEACVGQGVILGDSFYPNKRWLMALYRTTVLGSLEDLFNWDATYPHVPNSQEIMNDLFPEKNRTHAQNFCRNPGNDAGGPWCYTTDPQKRYEYCNIPFCDDGESLIGCKNNDTDFGYSGAQTKTENGRTCQRWDVDYPHSHAFNEDELFPEDGGKTGAQNFCRNPEKNGAPWCYTTDSLTRYEYCKVPTCG